MLRRLLVMPFVYGLLVIFAACAQPGALPTVTLTSAPPASATAAASVTATEPNATNAPTEAATRAPSDTPAGATRTPTTAPSDTPTDAATDTPSGPTSTPVLEALDTQSTSTTSPDGRWVAVAAVSYPTLKNGVTCEGCSDQYFARLTVHRADNSLAWTAIAEWRPLGLGAPLPAVHSWSADGAALYYTNLVRPDGCGFFSSNGTDLWRLDLATGAVKELLPAKGYYLVLSPDETRVAYLTFGQPKLVVHDLVTGAEREYPLADLGGQLGAAVWSPDASALALTVQTEACGGPGMTQMVIEVKLADGARRVLLLPSDRLLTTVAWPAADKLSLVDPAGAHWVLTVSTGQVTPEG